METMAKPQDFSQEKENYKKAKKRVEVLKGFYGHLFSYFLVMPFLVFINLQTFPQYHWFWWPVLGGGASVIIHSLYVFGFGKNWEEKKIKEIMSQQSKNQINGNFQ